jgi:hypothetical protein
MAEASASSPDPQGRRIFIRTAGLRHAVPQEHIMSMKRTEIVSVRITPNDKGSPVGKLADAEVVFESGAGPFTGLKLVGFAVWERRNGAGRNVTFPARAYSVNGERRSFALLRPAKDDLSGQDAVRDLILEAYSAIEEAPAASPR